MRYLRVFVLFLLHFCLSACKTETSLIAEPNSDDLNYFETQDYAPGFGSEPLASCLKNKTVEDLFAIHKSHALRQHHYNNNPGVKGYLFNLSNLDLGVSCDPIESENFTVYIIPAKQVSDLNLDNVVSVVVPRSEIEFSEESHHFGVYLDSKMQNLSIQKSIPIYFEHRTSVSSDIDPLVLFLHEWEHHYFKTTSQIESQLRYLPKPRSMLVAKAELQKPDSVFVKKVYVFLKYLSLAVEKESPENIGPALAVLKNIENHHGLAWDYFRSKEIQEGFSVFYSRYSLFEQGLLNRESLIPSSDFLYVQTASYNSLLLISKGIDAAVFNMAKKLSESYEQFFNIRLDEPNPIDFDQEFRELEKNQIGSVQYHREQLLSDLLK